MLACYDFAFFDLNNMHTLLPKFLYNKEDFDAYQAVIEPNEAFGFAKQEK